MSAINAPGFDPNEEERWYETIVLGMAEGRGRHENAERVADLPRPPAVVFDPVDWREAWNRPDDDAFLLEPVLLDRRHHLLYAPRKTGKSLVVLEWCAALASGRRVLNRPASEPVDVLVIDLENDVRDDVIERAEEMGYRADDFERLHWYSFPPMAGLDTPRGADQLDALITKHQPALVVLDSFARVVSGPEDKADTVRAYYQHAGIVLKRHRVCSIRLDNSGKDESAGARGSSAKGDDVDLIWRLKATEGGLQLRREAQRANVVPDHVNLRRVDTPNLHHVLVDDAWPAGTMAAAKALDRLGIPRGASVRQARQALKDAGEPCASDVLAAAVRYRKRLISVPEHPTERLPVQSTEQPTE
jgi:hypothetical protein